MLFCVCLPLSKPAFFPTRRKTWNIHLTACNCVLFAFVFQMLCQYEDNYTSYGRTKHQNLYLFLNLWYVNMFTIFFLNTNYIAETHGRTTKLYPTVSINLTRQRKVMFDLIIPDVVSVGEQLLI